VTKEELQSLADQVIVNWNLEVGGDRRRAFMRTWFRFLGDLDHEATQQAIDDLILADKPFPPRAGTVRRMVLAERLCDVPTVDAAWAQAQARIHAVQQGIWSDVSPLVGEALAAAQIHGTSRDDHEAFVRAWRQVVERLELERLGLPVGAE